MVAVVVSLSLIACGWSHTAEPILAPIPEQRKLQDKSAPPSWKEAEFSKLLPHSDDSEDVSILVWEKIDFGEVKPALDRCVVFKKYKKPDGEKTCCLGYFLRWHYKTRASWELHIVYLTDLKPSDPKEKVGLQAYKHLPTDDEIAIFFATEDWARQVKPGFVTKGGGGEELRREMYTPKLLDGGVCVETWKKVFNRTPPPKLFPELMVKPGSK